MFAKSLWDEKFIYLKENFIVEVLFRMAEVPSTLMKL